MMYNLSSALSQSCFLPDISYHGELKKDFGAGGSNMAAGVLVLSLYTTRRAGSPQGCLYFYLRIKDWTPIAGLWLS